MFIVVGTNHKYSPISLREKLSFSKKRLKDALFFLKERGLLDSSVILSTCNRTEIYASCKDVERGIKEIQDFLSIYYEINKKEILPYLYVHENKEALKHLFLVTSGLDSLILGETQILGQVRSAILESEQAGFMNSLSRDVFYSAISFASQIHASTTISEGKVSVGSVAIDFVRKRIGALSGKNILIIGVGKVTELVLKYLKKEKANVIFVSNRTFQKAKELSSRIGAEAVRFDDLKQYLKKADVVITATASRHFIIRREMIEEVEGRLLIIDLALPRDVDPKVGELENVDLFYLEDLKTTIKENISKKAKAAQEAEGLIDKELERTWIKLLRLEQEVALWH